MIKKLEKTFGGMIKEGRKCATPGTPNLVMVRPKGDDPLVTEKERELCRTGVGMLLHLVKHSRPDIANAMRELSKLNDGVTSAAMKELLRRKCAGGIKDYHLRIKHFSGTPQCRVLLDCLFAHFWQRFTLEIPCDAIVTSAVH